MAVTWKRQVAATLLALLALLTVGYMALSLVLTWQADLECKLDGLSGGSWSLGTPVCWELHHLRPNGGRR